MEINPVFEIGQSVNVKVGGVKGQVRDYVISLGSVTYNVAYWEANEFTIRTFRDFELEVVGPYNKGFCKKEE
jgi:hypothetical protein